MFLTTMRVREARQATLNDHGIERQGRKLVEITCHAQAVAVIDVEGRSPKPLWFDVDVGHSDELARMAKLGVGVMASFDHAHLQPVPA